MVWEDFCEFDCLDHGRIIPTIAAVTQKWLCNKWEHHDQAGRKGKSGKEAANGGLGVECVIFR